MKLHFWIGVVSCLVLAVIAEAGEIGRELIRDPEFRNGFQVFNPNGSSSGDIRIPGNLSTAGEREGSISWSVTQWGSLYSMPLSPVMSGAQVTWLTKGYKRLTVNTQSHTLEFYLNSMNEYHHVFRHSDDSRKWPHLLINQLISDPYRPSQQSVSIGKMGRLKLSLVAQLIDAKNDTGPGYDLKLHASQFVLYFTLQNLNPNSKGFGEFVWFGIPLYDSRYAFPKSELHVDQDTRSMVYSVDSKKYLSIAPQTKKQMTISYDPLPEMRQALNYAFNQNLLTSKDLDDYKIGSMNTGLEITGLAIVTFRISQLSLLEQ